MATVSPPDRNHQTAVACMEALEIIETNSVLTHYDRAALWIELRDHCALQSRQAYEDHIAATSSNLCEICSHPLIEGQYIQFQPERVCTDCLPF
jgi:hypothetical protein